MEIENNKEQVPFSYYEGLFRSLDPADVCSRLGNIWDGTAFCLTLLGKPCRITHPVYSIDCDLPLPVQTFLLRYLLEGSRVAWGGQWKTFREMPWGEMYIKPYTGRVLNRASFTFGKSIAAFRAACEKMGAAPLPHADAGYQFELIGGYWMQCLVWEGDAEFPPSAQVLYSDNFAAGFAAEDRVVAADILIGAIKANM